MHSAESEGIEEETDGGRGKSPSGNRLWNRLKEAAGRWEVYVGMKTKIQLLGLAAGLALFTAGCASDDASGAPPTVIIDRGQSSPVIIEKEKSSPTPVVIERDSDKDVKVDVEVDKD